MKKSDESLRQAQQEMENRKRLLFFGKIRVDPEPVVDPCIKQKTEETDDQAGKQLQLIPGHRP